ncbi:MAG: pentapeptide repeat-containing protein [Rhodobacteraceae bacterium]|nr:MAG: pentapeptide repeat-containing protein [Paracoccaceae bacterium]
MTDFLFWVFQWLFYGVTYWVANFKVILLLSPVSGIAGLWLFFRLAPKAGRKVSSFIKTNYVELVWSLGVLLFAYACIFYLWDIIRSVAGMVDLLRAEAGKEPPATEDIRNLAYAVAVLLGVLVAVSTIPFGLIKVWMSERSTNAAEQGLITERITKAVAGLGADKTDKVVADDGTSTEGTEPNLEVRIGSIYALERIAQDSDRDHISVMQILCTYIRTNAPWNSRKQNARDAADEFPRDDIQTALDVIGRRGADKKNLERAQGYGLDLRFANLKLADMRGGDFADAWFNGSLLAMAFLERADMTGAMFSGTNLQNARLSKASFNIAGAFKADFTGSDITQAQINAMFGDGTVTFPEHLKWPKHWPEQKLEFDAFVDERSKWLDNPAGYTPPKPPEKPAKKPAKKTNKST